MISPEELRLAEAAEQLVASIEDAIGDWVMRSVHDVVTATGRQLEPAIVEAAAAAARDARGEIPRQMAELVRQDPDEQRETPLQVLRGAVQYPTDVLASFAVPPPPRDRYAEERFPADIYDLVPVAFADLGPEVGDAGLVWGAARALVHRARHGAPRDQEIDDR